MFTFDEKQSAAHKHAKRYFCRVQAALSVQNSWSGTEDEPSSGVQTFFTCYSLTKVAFSETIFLTGVTISDHFIGAAGVGLENTEKM